MKKKLLYYGDTPHIFTGFGNVARHVLLRLADEYDITVFGINEFFNNPATVQCEVIPALPNVFNDPYGRQKFIDLALKSGRSWDVWFLQNDIHFWHFFPEVVYLIRAKGRNPYIFMYTVVDGPINRLDVYNISIADVCGIPSKYGIEEICKVDPGVRYKLAYIPHGIDASEFFPMPDEVIKQRRSQLFRCNEDDFLIANVNRNASRKDITRTLLYFTHLRKRIQRVKLYLHMQSNEEKNKGYDLDRILFANDSSMKDIALPSGFSADRGVPLSLLNDVYNCADMVVSTSVGEGFGLSAVEAMATKTLAMMPSNSSLTELLEGGHGILVKCGETLSDWTILSMDPGFPRPLTDVEDMIAKTVQVVKNYPQDIVDEAYRWVTSELPWSKVAEKFRHAMKTKPSQVGLEGRVFI